MPIGTLVTDKTARTAEYRRRKPRFAVRRASEADAIRLQLEGWEIATRLKRGVRLKKQKSDDEMLEDDFWAILYHFGYKELNSGRNFSIEIVVDRSVRVTKQIDVFAVDDETVVVAECKSSLARQRRQLQKDLGEFEANKRPIAQALRSHYGETFNKKIIWLFVTRNIDWSEPDLARAKGYNIRVLRERDLRYFSEVATRLGPSGRFQFHAEFLARSQAISQMTVPAVKTKLGGRNAFFFVAPPRKLLPISYVNHRTLRDPDAAPSYQRLVVRSRLREIASYIAEGGYFPNAILANFPDAVRFDRAGPESDDGTCIGTLTLPDQYKSVWIIDGQHRLYGYAEHGENDSRHRIPVVAFERLPMAEEARLFKTINSEQRKVSKQLIDELRGEQDLHSENRQVQMRAIAVRVMEQLRTESGGPFQDRLKDSDLPASPERSLTLSQVCNSIVASGLIGRLQEGAEERFIQGPFGRDTAPRTVDALAEGLSALFSHIRSANEIRWRAGKAGQLCYNPAVQAYIRVFAELCRFYYRETGIDPRELGAAELVEQIGNYLAPVLEFIKSSDDDEFSRRFKVAFGSGGPTQYFNQVSLLIRAKTPSFNPDGLEEYLRQIDVERRDRADQQVRTIQERVPSFIVERLKTVYGDQDFLSKAIKNHEILVDAFRKRTAAPVEEQGPLETYIDFIDFKKIVESRDNWGHFKEELDVPIPGEARGLAKYVKWFDEVNRIRRVPAHPYGKLYKDEDVALLQHVCDVLTERGVI